MLNINKLDLIGSHLDKIQPTNLEIMVDRKGYHTVESSGEKSTVHNKAASVDGLQFL
eukprot:m.217885 g.217885  ORF g.217885 m.217885 type:complete len:57 (+) comp39883_c1_seq109:1690-1860(+)